MIESITLHQTASSPQENLDPNNMNQDKDEQMLDVPPEEEYHARYHGFITVTEPIDFGIRTTVSSNYRTVWKDHITFLTSPFPVLIPGMFILYI